jgi:hypothetical protein
LKKPNRISTPNTKRCPVMMWIPFLTVAEFGEIFNKNNANQIRASKVKIPSQF